MKLNEMRSKSLTKVSESSRHVAWRRSKGSNYLSHNDFPEELTKAKKARTFSINRYGNHISQSFLEKVITNFSCLRTLELESSIIEVLPSSIGNLKHLRLLNLSKNRIIKSLPDTICELLNLQTLYLNGCRKLKVLPKRIHRLISLQCFYVSTRQRSLVGTQFSGMPCIQHLIILSCNRLTTLWESYNVGRLASIRVLCIENCPRLSRLPSSMKLLVVLEELWIRNCQELHLEVGDALSGLQSLRCLEIRGIPRVTCLPDGLQSAARSLQYLWLKNCQGLLKLPNWLRSFASLQILVIHSCPNLSKRCAVPVGEDYPLIQHVSEFWLDGYTLTRKQK